MLAFMRFMTGIGIGSLMPSTVALASDYAPDRLRATVTMWVFAGNPLGGFLGGQIIALLLPIFGWQVIFYVGGALPLVLFPILLIWMPESPRFLLARGIRTASALRIFAVTGINPDATPAARRVDLAETTNTVVALFTDGYAMRTILFWILFFASLLSLYLIGFWLPTVLHLEGLSPSDAVFAASLYSAGGGLSVLLLGPLSSRFGTDRVLTVCLACGIVIIAAVALGRLPYVILLAAIFIMGICVVGGQLGANGLSAAKYPARIRTTGVGWALGIGRIGAIVGPVVGGVLLAAHFSPRNLFFTIAVPALIAAGAMFWLRLRLRHVDAVAPFEAVVTH
jgi:MFS transporter, AAHS family, 4-hydroxybenzoate transporter